MSCQCKRNVLCISFWGVGFSSVLLLYGCSTADSQEQLASVKVSVSSGGKPVKTGTVQMTIPGEGVYSAAVLDQAGQGEMEDVKTGEYTVFVTPPPIPAPHATGMIVKQKPHPEIPTQVRSEKTSPLKAKVTSGKNEFHFELAEIKSP
ncbi:hypothetical protein Mal35_15820 [Gimesia maris]|uniref:hypothetical protein n=1 Tax=Gimesia maris TaxID=122 RepID=UPI00118B7100|nr:hypothetical protein [Gimesia maris]QDT78151.1 hypothetical protein Mal35_15820 [Gimesia maris]